MKFHTELAGGDPSPDMTSDVLPKVGEFIVMNGCAHLVTEVIEDLETADLTDFYDYPLVIIEPCEVGPGSHYSDTLKSLNQAITNVQMLNDELGNAHDALSKAMIPNHGWTLAERIDLFCKQANIIASDTIRDTTILDAIENDLRRRPGGDWLGHALYHVYSGTSLRSIVTNALNFKEAQTQSQETI